MRLRPQRLVLPVRLLLPVLLAAASALPAAAAPDSLLTALRSPILLHGDSTTAFRDPILARVGSQFYLIYSYVRTEQDQKVYWYTALSTSRDLQHWSAPHIVTPRSQNLNYSSPGSLTRVGNEWILSLQTIPMNGVRLNDPPPIHWPEEPSRLWTMTTRDFKTWTAPELIRVKGPTVPQQDMGKMIDPFLLQDKDVPGKWWCFFKQGGDIHESWSMDRHNWHPLDAPIAHGENPEVLVDTTANDYVLFYSPQNGTGVKRSTDLIHWTGDGPPITLGQKDWPYAETRITAGYVADLRNVPGVGKYVLVCHTMGPGTQKTNHNVLTGCNIVIAWSDDLKTWHWPGEKTS
jgi:hypothetical protein